LAKLKENQNICIYVDVIDAHGNLRSRIAQFKWPDWLEKECMYENEKHRSPPRQGSSINQVVTQLCSIIEFD
jgi:hypothetical protein